MKKTTLTIIALIITLGSIQAQTKVPPQNPGTMLSAPMEILESTGSFENAEYAFLSLNAEFGTITLMYHDEERRFFPLSIVDRHDSGCGSVEYVAESRVDDQYLIVVLKDHTNRICMDLISSYWEAIVIAGSDNVTTGTMRLAGRTSQAM